MQKKLIALAVLSTLSTAAFADASIYGTVDAAVAAVSATGQKSDMLLLSGGASTSRIGVNASEDLSNGMKAIVNLEYALDTVTAQTTTVNVPAPGTTSAVSSIAARQQLLGLAGNFGTVAAGYLQTTGYDWENKYDPLAGTKLSPLQTMNQGFLVGTIAVAARAQRALAYISPDLSGLTLAVNYTTGFTGLGNVAQDSALSFSKDTAILVSGNYARGPIGAGLVIANYTAATTAAGVKGNDVADVALGGSYDLGTAKLYATYQTSKVTAGVGGATNNRKALSLSGVIPVGADAVAVQFAKNSSDTANAGASGYTLGYMHTLSKTTMMYAAYESVKNDSATAAFSADNNALAASAATGWTAGGGSSSALAVGLRKKF